MEDNNRDIVHSKKIRAGRRTYFLDVKSTKSDDYYITLTESKKRFRDNGTHFFEKHKIFLYKEDFNKFLEGLQEVVDHVKQDLMPDYDFSEFDRDEEDEINHRSSRGYNSDLEEDELKWE